VQNYSRGVSNPNPGQSAWGQRSTTFAGYLEDNWRIADNFTLNLGLRYEAHTPWVEVHDRQTNFGLSSGAIELAGKNGNSRALYNGQYGILDFQPRLGFAWTPAALGKKTVVRGAFTISSYLEGTGTNLRLTMNPPFTPAEFGQNFNNVLLPTDSTGLRTTGKGITQPTDPFAGASVRLWDPEFQPSVAKQWNFSVQHQLSNSTTLQVGYVGQYADHLANPMWLIQNILNEPYSFTRHLHGRQSRAEEQTQLNPWDLRQFLDGLQRAPGRPAKAHGQRITRSGRIHLFQVHDQFSGILRLLG
jgi:hypothetical protein